MTDIEKTNKAMTEGLADTFAKSNNRAYQMASKKAKQTSNPADFMDVMATETGEDLNTLVGNSAVLVGEQWVEKQGDKLYGNVFKLAGTFNTGGTYITLYPNNMVGLSTPTNYQTSTSALSNIAWGDSLTSADIISIKVVSAPLVNYNSISGHHPFATLNLTIPEQFASFSSLSPIKAGEIIDGWRSRVEQTHKIFFYGLGNMLFTDFLPANTYTCTSTTMYALLQDLLIPLIESMKMGSARFNAGVNYTQILSTSTSLTDSTYLSSLMSISQATLNQNNPFDNLQDWEILENESSTAKQCWLNIDRGDHLVMYMSPQTEAGFLALLQTTAIGKNAIDIQTNGNKVTSICGVPVKTAGTMIGIPQQTAQGTALTPGLDSGYALDKGKIVLIDDEYLTWYKYWDSMFGTDTFVNAMVKIVRLQLGYIPVVKPWLNGIVLDISSALANPYALPIQQVSSSN